ncbi:hypothetical protein [Haloarcula sp. H-GB5]
MRLVLLLSGVLRDEARIEMLVLLLIVGTLLIGVPTVGMYREANQHDNHPSAWTVGMFLLALGIPVFGPILLWLLYTGIEVKR